MNLDEIFYIDTNVLVAYFVRGHSLHKKAVELIEFCKRNEISIALSPLVVDEVLYVIALLHKKGYLANGTKKVVNILIEGGFSFVSLSVWEEEVIQEIYRFMKAFKLKPRDAFHLKIMLDNNIKSLLTFDSDFNLAAKAGIIEVVSSL